MAAQDSKQPPLVFLLAGQSNMVGHGKAAELPQEYAKAPANVHLFESGKLRPLSARADGEFGPEISFGHELAKAMPDRVIIFVKHSTGGTSLDKDWNPSNRNRLYDKLLANYKEATKGQKHELVAVLWSQGGADAKDEASAKAYAARFKEFIESLRKDLDAPKLPFYFSGAKPDDPVTPGMKSRFPHIEHIRTAYVETAKTVPQTMMVSTVGLKMGRDGIHYDTAGQIDFGKRYAEAYLKTANNK